MLDVVRRRAAWRSYCAAKRKGGADHSASCVALPALRGVVQRRAIMSLCSRVWGCSRIVADIETRSDAIESLEGELALLALWLYVVGSFA